NRRSHLKVGEDGNTTGADKAKPRAHRCVGYPGSRSTDAGKDVIVSLKSCHISDIRSAHVLKPRARFCIDHAKHLPKSGGTVGRGHIVMVVPGIEPNFIAAAHLSDEGDDVAVNRVDDDGIGTLRYLLSLKL